MKTLKPMMAFAALLCASPALHAENLLDIYRQALEADPQVKAAQMQIMVGEAQTGQALSAMLPQITASANWSTNQQRREIQFRNGDTGHANEHYYGTRYVVSLNQTLIDFAKYWNWRRAKKVEDQFAAENQDTLNQLIYDVIDRYFKVLETEDQLAFSQSETRASEKRLTQVKKLFEKRLVKITDLYSVEARFTRNQAEELEAFKNVEVAREALVQLTGKMPESLQGLGGGIEYKPLEGEIDEWLKVAQSHNPAILAKASAVKAADDNVTAQQARHLPVVDLQLNYYSTNTGYQSSNIGETETQVAAINVSVPIFSGGEIWYGTKEAKYKLAISRYDREDTLRKVVKETRDAFLSTNANYKRILATEKALKAATKSREAMEKGFSYRMETMNDLLDAQQDEFKMQKELSRARYEYIRNKTRFLYAVGTIGEENLEEINAWLQKPASAENGESTAKKLEK